MNTFDDFVGNISQRDKFWSREFSSFRLKFQNGTTWKGPTRDFVSDSAES